MAAVIPKYGQPPDPSLAAALGFAVAVLVAVVVTFRHGTDWFLIPRRR